MATNQKKIEVDQSTKKAAPAKAQGNKHNEGEKNLPDRRQLQRQACDQAWNEMTVDSKGYKTCPWCGWQGVYGSEEDEMPMKTHLVEHHPIALSLYYANPDLGFEAVNHFSIIEKEEDDESFEPFPDTVDINDWEDFDMLEVPKDLKDKYAKKGGRLRWAADDRVQFYKDRGAEIPDRTEYDAEGPRQEDHSDTRVRMNEMTLVYFPEPVATRFDAMNQRRITSQGDLKGSQEYAEKRMGDIGKKAYEHFRKNGMSHENSMMMSKKAESAHHNGLNAGPDRIVPGENRYTHTRP